MVSGTVYIQLSECVAWWQGLAMCPQPLVSTLSSLATLVSTGANVTRVTCLAPVPPLWPLWPQATTPNIEMSVWLLCSCEAAINNARIVAATIIYSSEANRLIWKNEGCLEPDVDVKVKLKWGWSLNAAQTEYRSGRRLLECLPGKIKQECPNNNAAHRSITNDKKIPLIMEAVSPFKLLTRLLHCLNCWQCL